MSAVTSRCLMLSLIFVLSLSAACGGGGGGSDAVVAAPGSFSLTDSWAGEYSTATQNFSFSGSLVQAGNLVTGELFTSTGFTLMLDGTVSGSDVSFTLTGTAPGCSGSYSGSGQVLDNGSFHTMTFSFTGSDCTGPISANGYMDSQTQAAPSIFDVTGSWSGTYTLPAPTGTVSVTGTLTQNGNQITGALVSSNGSILQISSSVLSPTMISFGGQSGGNGCSGTFSGTASLSADPLLGAQISFNVSGVDSCAGVYNGATGLITRN